MTPEPLALLRAVADVLDSLGVGAYVLDDADRTLLWNRTFLRLFPEHGGKIYSGEPYERNLRRFYEGRLGPDERAHIDRYVRDGLDRNRNQARPIAFEHHGRRLRAGSLPLPGVGRIRIWLEQPSTATSEAASSPGAGHFDQLPDGVMVTTPDGLVGWVNETFVSMFGLSDRGAAIGRTFEQLYREVWVDAPDPTPGEAGRATLATSLRYVGAPIELPMPANRCLRLIGQRGADGRGFFALVDITELKRKQDTLAEAEQRARDSEARLHAKTALLEATLQRMDQGVMMVNAERVVEVCNPRAIELLGLPADMMAARPRFEDVLAYQWAQDEFRHSPEDLQDFVRAGGILDKPHSYDRRRPDGTVIEVHSVPIEGGGVLRTYTDITERKRHEDDIRHRARHDSLTSLVNRETFREQLDAAIVSRGRSGDAFAVHLIDLDRFKPVNDRHGHAVGDRVLAAVAERMRQVARDGDTVARLGGDEFAILQRGAVRPDHALGLARRVLDAVRRPVEVGGLTLEVGASIGIALVPGSGNDADAVLRCADAAMYAAKSERDGVRLYAAPGSEAQ